mgnify:CR=1 FL=1
MFARACGINPAVIPVSIHLSTSAYWYFALVNPASFHLKKQGYSAPVPSRGFTYDFIELKFPVAVLLAETSAGLQA